MPATRTSHIRIRRFLAPLALAATLPLAGRAAAEAPGEPAPSPSASAAPTAPASASAAPSAGVADPVAGRYVSQCSGCHTIGGGKLKGPDLEKALEWSESSLKLAVRKMEKNVGALPDADVDAYVAFLKAPDVRDRIANERKRAMAEMAAKLEPPNAATGRALFFGQKGLEHQGLACAACHQAGGEGGTLGPDLTSLATKMDATGMVSAFEQTNFAVMRDAYREHPVTKQEAVHLAAFFGTLPSGTSPWWQTTNRALALGGVALPALGMLSLLALFRGRSAGVRARLLRDAVRR